MNITVKYKIALEGNDIDTKKVQKLKPGAPLLLKRVNDEEDTFEICVCHPDGREIDMLSYSESIGVAPFIDREIVTATAKAESVAIKPGKSRRKDITELTVAVEYEYPQELQTVHGEKGFAFVDTDDAVLTLAAANAVNGGADMPVERPYLNLYTLSLPMAGMNDLFEGDVSESTLGIKVLFNESFTKCKITAEINGQREELDENEKQTVLTLVNHHRIFEGEEGVNREIEE